MKRKIRKLRNKIHMPQLRTRRRKAGSLALPPFLKPAALILSAVIFILVVIPFTITLVFIPDTTVPEKTADKIDKAPITESIKKQKIPASIKVYRKAKGVTEKIPFEDYIKGVVASEMPSSFEKEALKAQAVAARTYSLSKYLNAKKNGNSSSHPGAPVCDTVHCQVFQDQKGLKKTKGSKWMKSDWKKISTAVEDTKGELMYYNGKLVEQALFHSSSGGKTENCEDVFTAAVPYLVSVESPYEDEATHKNENTSFTISEFASKIKAAYPSTGFGTVTANNIKILARSNGGRVDKVQIGSGTASGVQVREALGLYSANFKISIANGKITFTTTGSGHGVGMSQYGANGMAKAGYDYKKILSHYYKGTTII